MRPFPVHRSSTPRFLTATMSALLAATSVSANTWVRSNLLGNPVGEIARVTILADTTQAGSTWRLLSPNGGVLAEGILPASGNGSTAFSPKSYGTTLDLPVTHPGSYRLVLSGRDTTTLVTGANPWSFLAGSAIRHLRLMRSGPDQSLFRVPSHLGDTSCPVMVPDGSWANGAWKPEPGGRRVRAVGGWYDAGDQIKFTLTTAYTTEYLLRALQANPGIHPRNLSGSTLPDILEEARHGLDYLATVLIDDTTFVIQVGDGADHEQGARLPQNDALDGRRPALCALSPMPMAYTGAALALGARVFHDLDPVRAESWKQTALRIHRLLNAPGASREVAFYRQEVNDFYADPSPYDNLALLETELFALTDDSTHLASARTFADSASTGFYPDWTDVGVTVDADLASSYEPSRTRLRQAYAQFHDFATRTATLWGVPNQPTWGPLLGWPIVGAEAIRAQDVLGDSLGGRLARDILDYMLGRNNWGVSFVMSRHIERSVRNIFGPIYRLSGEFPEGAVAEGPGDHAIHDGLDKYFSIPPDASENQFNTPSVVFYDHASDFQTMETTISQQATFLYLLSVVTRSLGDTIAGVIPPAVVDSQAAYEETLVERPIPLSRGLWDVYDDKSEKGISSAQLLDFGDSSGGVAFHIAIGDSLPYAYAGLFHTFAAGARALDWKNAVGLRIRHELPSGRSVRMNLRTTAVKDYDEFGTTIIGKGSTRTTVLFRDLAQQGFGVAFGKVVPATATAIEFIANAPVDSLALHVTGIDLLFDPASGVEGHGTRATQAIALVQRGTRVFWSLDKERPGSIELIGADGRRQTLRQGTLPRQGELDLDARTAPRWIRLRTDRGSQVLTVAPILRSFREP